jgi:hypothetical protein
MRLPPNILQNVAARRRAEQSAAERDRRRDYIITGVLCIGWAALGLALIMWSAHTGNSYLGRAAFYGGLGLGNAGIIFSLLAAYRRGEKRGDW